MGQSNSLHAKVTGVLNNAWDIRDGQVVPTTDNVKLSGGAVKLRATMLYADLADSTELAMGYDSRVAAKVYKCFLVCATTLIRSEGGHIRSFDGDRVMGVFIGNRKNTCAAKCALKINYAFLQIVKPRVLAKYDTLQNGNYSLAHCVGIDTSDVMVVRGGVRNHNDLLWIGRAPNVAAKLSTLRQSPYHSYVTEAVYSQLSKEAKLSSDGREMWQKCNWKSGPDSVTTLYRSRWQWEP